MFKKISLSAIALIATVGLAYAGGAFQGFPLVSGDGATNCLSFGNNAVCNQFQPGGPAQLSGNETIPADTNVQGGGTNGNPNTVNISILELNAGPYQYAAPLTGTSITVANTSRRLMLEPAGTIAALTVVMPPAGSVGSATQLLDNQTFGICSTQVITALTITDGAGATVLNKATATVLPSATAAGCFEWVYRKANTSWYRVQ